MIDIHTHILTVWGGEEAFTEEKLIKRMDELKIDRFVILPLGASPETPYFYFGTEDVLEVYHRHPDRVIPFAVLTRGRGITLQRQIFPGFLISIKKKVARAWENLQPIFILMTHSV